MAFMSMDECKIRELKKKLFLTAYRAGAAHLASAFSVMDLLYVMYCNNIVDLKDGSENRDRVILSKGHAGLALYTILNSIGIISDAELLSFCQPGSHLGGEPKMGSHIGIEASTGSLGHGLPFGVGVAIASKIRGWDNKIYVIIGDGECEEGSVWEAVMAAKRFKLDNLVVIMDDNRLQAMDSVEEIMNIDLWRDKWESFGFNVVEIDGHNTSEIKKALSLKMIPETPRLIISHTIKGKGISFMENVPIWHYRMPNESELKIVMDELNISPEELSI